VEFFQAAELAGSISSAPTRCQQDQAVLIDTCPIYLDGLTIHLSTAGYRIAAPLFDLISLDVYADSLVELYQPLCIIGPHLKTYEAFEACRRVRAANSWARVALVSQHCDDPIFKADAAYAGALACMPVGVPPETLLNALSLVMAGQSLIPVEFQQLQVKPLTEREIDVLRLIAEDKTVPEIAAALFLGKGTVDKHKHKQSIFRKMSVRNRYDAVLRARHLGWL